MKKIDNYKEKGYSVFENTDKELVAKIKSIKPKSSINIGDVVNHWRSGECVVKSFINDKEALVYSEENNCHEVHQLENKDEQLMDDHLQLINDTFKVGDYFTQNFGIIGHNGTIVYGIENALPPNPYRKESYHEVSVAALKQTRIDTRFYEGFRFEYSESFGSVSCFFDENGNYVNRDTNFDLESYDVVDPKVYIQEQIDKFINHVSTIVPDELYHLEGTDTWFSENFCYIVKTKEEKYDISYFLNLMVDAKPKQGNGNAYYHNGESSDSSRLTKKCEKSIVTKDSFLDELRNIITLN